MPVSCEKVRERETWPAGRPQGSPLHFSFPIKVDSILENTKLIFNLADFPKHVNTGPDEGSKDMLCPTVRLRQGAFAW